MNDLPTEAKRDLLHKTLAKCESIDYQLIGRSILSKPIYCYRVGKGSTKLLYVGAHHGSEYLTALHLYNFLLSFAKGRNSCFGILPELYLKSYSVFVVPCLNPDGVDMSIEGIPESVLRVRQLAMLGEGNVAKWKANARGVDLNHNYPYGFSQYKEIESARKIYAGPTLFSGEHPISEPETKAIMRIIQSIDISFVLSLHSAGEEVYYYPKIPRVRRYADFIADSLGYKISSPTGTAMYGGLCDYTAGELNIPSVTLEVGRGENPLPLSEVERIKDRLDRVLYLLPTRL